MSWSLRREVQRHAAWANVGRSLHGIPHFANRVRIDAVANPSEISLSASTLDTSRQRYAELRPDYTEFDSTEFLLGGRIVFAVVGISIFYILLLLAASIGCAQYMLHVRRLWWLPYLFGIPAMMLAAIWRWSWDMSFESLNSKMLTVSYYLVILTLLTFVAQALIGWWFWNRVRLTRRCS